MRVKYVQTRGTQDSKPPYELEQLQKGDFEVIVRPHDLYIVDQRQPGV